MSSLFDFQEIISLLFRLVVASQTASTRESSFCWRSSFALQVSHRTHKRTQIHTHTHTHTHTFIDFRKICSSTFILDHPCFRSSSSSFFFDVNPRYSVLRRGHSCIANRSFGKYRSESGGVGIVVPAYYSINLVKVISFLPDKMCRNLNLCNSYLSAWFSKSEIKDVMDDKANLCPPGSAHPPPLLHVLSGCIALSFTRCSSIVHMMRAWSP